MNILRNLKKKALEVEIMLDQEIYETKKIDLKNCNLKYNSIEIENDFTNINKMKNYKLTEMSTEYCTLKNSNNKLINKMIIYEPFISNKNIESKIEYLNLKNRKIEFIDSIKSENKNISMLNKSIEYMSNKNISMLNKSIEYINYFNENCVKNIFNSEKKSLVKNELKEIIVKNELKEFFNDEKNIITDEKMITKATNKVIKSKNNDRILIKKMFKNDEIRKLFFKSLNKNHLKEIIEIHFDIMTNLLFKKIRNENDYDKYKYLINMLNKNFKFEIALDEKKTKEYENIIEEILKHVNKGNYECDIRFYEKIKKEIKNVHVYDDPVICKMTVLFVLCKNYIKDFIAIKTIMKKYSDCDL